MSITISLTWIFIFVAIAIFILFLTDKRTKIKRVIFFGDSITGFGVQPNGYISVMQKLLAQQNISNYELLSAGISGNKVYDLLVRMNNDVIVHSPDIVVLWVGVNDVWHTNNLFAEPDTAEFEKNYTLIIEKLLANKIQLMLVTPAIIGEKRDNTNPLDKDLQNHCEVIRAIADTYKLPLCDMHELFHLYEMNYNKANAIKGILTVDGVHLNDMGNRFAAGEILKVLKEM